MTRQSLTVAGMSCQHCRAAVSRAVSAVAGVSAVEVSLEQKSVCFDFDGSAAVLDRVKQAVQAEGYQVVG